VCELVHIARLKRSHVDRIVRIHSGIRLRNQLILARLIPNARLQMIDDGHLFMVTRPTETAMTIEAFLCDQ
jgi:hypothetical protein